MSLLEIRHLRAGHGRTKVLEDVSLTIREGEFVGLIGPNGAGKTTLLRAAQGMCAFTGHTSLAALSLSERAKQVAFMPQGRDIAWPIPAERLVALGRMAHGRGGVNHPAVSKAIAALGLEEMRHRPATTLSGGEQARVLIARALAQETPLLIADEPAAGLDPAAQIAVMEIFAGLARQGKSVLASMHDLGLAVRYCTRLILLAKGRVMADGPPAEVLGPNHLAKAFGITAHFKQTPDGPIFQPLGLITKEAI